MSRTSLPDPETAPGHARVPGRPALVAGAGAEMPSLRLVRLAVHGAFYVLLVIAAGPALAGTAPVAVLPPAAVLAAVYGIGIVRSARRPGPWLAAVTALWLLLLAMDHGFSYVAFPLFFLFLHATP
ncbi:sensor histidine kinase, partial [Streptomyces sp. KLMMK]